MKKHIVCVISGSRAEFGLLRPLIARLGQREELETRLVVTGSHLSDEFGNTQNEVRESGFPIHAGIALPMEGDAKKDMVKTTAAAMSLFADYFSENRPELVVVLGDRYEIFGACSAAAMLGIPIAHLHGGETTQGAVDEFLRHAITKMSFLHFTSCEDYRRRVIQLGEAPERVFNVGALGVENVLKLSEMPLSRLEESLGIPLAGKRLAVVTFHPVTLEESTEVRQQMELIRAMEDHPELLYIVTKANADAGGRSINETWDHEAERHGNWRVVASLGAARYLSVLRHAEMMLGNSSSGILEAPALHVPTVNIGDRQKGRIMAQSVFCCEPRREDIRRAMDFAMSREGRRLARETECPFGDGHTSEKIAEQIGAFFRKGSWDRKKVFYDIGRSQTGAGALNLQ